MMGKEKVSIAINPPPKDKCCECCGRDIKNLKPFGKAGDPLVGDFDGSFLVKTFRTMAMPITDKDYIKLMKDAKANEYKTFEEDLIKKFGKEKADGLLFKDQLSNTVEASWECRDCIVLCTEDYFKIKYGS